MAALTDEDGRVRRAALCGINGFCVGCRMIGDKQGIDRLLGDLEEIREDVDGDINEHVAEAIETARGQQLL